MQKNSLLAFFALTLGLSGCANLSQGGFAELGSSVLNAAGVPVSSESLHTAFDAGEKISKAARGLTPEQEYYLGRGVSAVILSKYKTVKNEAVVRYVNRVARGVAIFSDRPETFGGYHVAVLDSAEINAVSAPGGFIFISKGFLKSIPNEESLAAVLAHEVGHIVKGHGMAAISQANLTAALTELGKEAARTQGGEITSTLAATFGDSITDVTNSLLEKGYSRSQEYEADAYAAELLKRAGYNQMGLIAMLEGLKTSTDSEKSGGWYSTHPKPERRLREAKDTVELSDSSNTIAESKGEAIRTNRFKSAMKGLV
ncbi:MAG: hypothetical protein EBZ48_09380 [Proteobacteria bacterium]|nr:hypothetical protein [Pseudomonadota bacterium]